MKISTQFFVVALTFFLGLSELAAQQENTPIIGIVKDDKGEVLPYVNVALLDEASESLITGAVTDEDGHFLLSVIKEGNFYLSVSSIGYETYRTEAFTLKTGQKRDFGVLTIKDEAATLGEVTVNAQRAQIVIEADKTIVNIEGTVLAEGNTALDVIGRSPGVFVDSDGNINLNGRSGVVVMLDDRQTYMSATDLADFLRAMPADNIKSIEVINNPSSRFDAEGAAGVINIKLKKNDLNGINGSANLGYRYNGIHAPTAGANLNIKKGKWTTNSSLNYNEWAQYNDLEILRRFELDEGTSSFDQEARLKLIRKNLFFNGGTDYKINDSHSVGINLQASRQNGTEDGLSETLISNPSTIDLNNLKAINDGRSDNNRLFGNFHYVGNLDTLGTKITADLDFTQMNAGSRSLLSNRYWLNDDLLNTDFNRILTENAMDYHIFTAKADYTRPLGKGKEVEMGVKGSWVKSDNELQLFKSEEEGPFMPDQNSNRFIYHENVLAAYGNYKTGLGEKLKLQAGLRLEYSDITGNSVTSNQINSQRYLDYFPSVNLNHKISDNYQITYTGNRRITRPNYRLLNPYVFYIDPLTVEVGNPTLTPQYATNLEMNHTIKGMYQVSLGYSRTQNAFGQIMVQDEETRTTSIQVQNLDVTENLNLRMIVPVEFAPWYTSNHTLQVSNNTFQSQLGDEMLDVSQVSMMARTQHNLTLGKGWKAEVVGTYMSRSRYGQMVLNGLAWVDAGITKSFKDDKWSMSINGSDLLRTQRFAGNIRFDQINTNVAQYNNIQSVRVGIRWKFSQGENFRVSQQSGSTEERNRLD
ncbi:outer membrane beta-barrel protein [Lunatibacter salilacus]|uniref:outer membrane beta-barrel protein n=1 Tax=Lunatibacter salilacus TaxID=2483804 RepID=UPI00131DBD83|nr:outer membrane beta-barrel protein [Lunatibacter salilacus]